MDDLPPITVITHVTETKPGVWTARGTTSDNGFVLKVLVNGLPARSLRPNFAEWEVIVENGAGKDLKLKAQAFDAAGNVEKSPHVIAVSAPQSR